MLIQFLVSNYASIKDEQILSMEPSNDNEHEENVVNKGQYTALNLAAVYGANASGKSSLFHAITMALNILRHSSSMQVNEPIPVIPFKFDTDSLLKPSKFEFTFVASDGVKYIYGYSADQTRVHEEYLYFYKSAKPSKIFDRHMDEYQFARSVKRYLEPLVRMNTSNKLFLATATSWNADCTTVPYNWLASGIDSYTNDENIHNYSLNMYKEKSDENICFTKKLMKQADINISDIVVESKKIPMPKGIPVIPSILINGQIVQPQEQYEISISAGHTVTDDQNNEKIYMLPLGEESLGTQQLFFIAPLLRQTFEEGKVLVIDEIDRSLHPFIVKYLVNLFRDGEVNKNGAQLIFTTHETTLLSLSIFRRDQIYFTEKNAASGATDLYSLDDFSVRKTDNIQKGYLLGRYGAIPFLNAEELV